MYVLLGAYTCTSKSLQQTGNINSDMSLWSQYDVWGLPTRNLHPIGHDDLSVCHVPFGYALNLVKWYH